jgi:Leucine-rich repeat (LRR) protein
MAYSCFRPALLLAALVLAAAEMPAAGVGQAGPGRRAPGAGRLAERVRVKAVVFVPKDVTPPGPEQLTHFWRHVVWAQKNYREMLGGRDTFALAGTAPEVVRGAGDRAHYERIQVMAPAVARELFQHDGVDRTSCPYVYVAVLWDRKWQPHGAPFNPGDSGGGGIVVMGGINLLTAPPFQWALVHELGHAFGLVHAGAYGYDQKTNTSVMAYNKDLHTNFFQPGRRPLAFIPEDVRRLARNKRVFPDLTFNPQRDVPPGYRIHPKIIYLRALNFDAKPGDPVDPDAGALDSSEDIRIQPEEREAVVALMRQGITCNMSDDGYTLQVIVSRELGADEIERSLRLIKCMSRLQVVSLDGTKATDGALRHLKDVPRLIQLGLSGTRVTDEGVKHLRPLKKLTCLNLDLRALTDAGLAHLAGLTELVLLRVGNSRITDDGLRYLRGLSKLYWLELPNTAVTDAGLAYLAELAEMEALYLHHTRVADDVFFHLRKMGKLRVLDLSGTRVTDEGLGNLAEFNFGMIEYLFLNDTRLTDAGLRHLRGLNRLRQLSLDGCPISDAGLVHLKRLPNLSSILLHRTQVTATGVRDLSGERPPREFWVSWDHPEEHPSRSPGDPQEGSPGKPDEGPPTQGPADDGGPGRGRGMMRFQPSR